YYLVNHLARELGLDKKRRIAIQGFGNAGQYYAQIAGADGHEVVAVSDSSGAIHKPDGLDVKTLIAGKAAGRSVSQLGAELGATPIAADALVGVDCDILVPAALEDMITKDNAGTIKARVVLELANGPVTPDADKILAERGIIVLPDILANAG